MGGKFGVKLDGAGEGVRRLNPLIFGLPPSKKGIGSALERPLHDQIFDECRARGWIAFHGSMAERTHRTEGEPDFTILADRGRTFLIECKSKTGKRSTKQNEMAHQAALLGHFIHTIRTFEEFRAIVDR